MKYDIACPIMGDEEVLEATKVIKSGILTNQLGGPKVCEFEEKLAKRLKVQNVIAFNNGTSALIAALMAGGVGPGDEVILPSLTFVATANAVAFLGAEPVFAESDGVTYCIDPADIQQRITGRTKAIIAVHLYGHVALMDPLALIAKKYNLLLIEDAAQALGSKIGGREAGTIGDMGCFSFYPSKIITCGEGGAVATNNPNAATTLRHVRNHGSVRTKFGLNLRMPEVCAAILVAQLDRLDGFLQTRRMNAARYELSIHHRLITLPLVRTGEERSWQVYTVKVRGDRDRVLRHLHENGIDARVYYDPPVHLREEYNRRQRLPRTETLVSEVLSLPCHPGLLPQDIQFIADKIGELTW